GQQPNVDVTVISGRSQEDLEAFLGGHPFRLIAEHGASLRGPGKKEWERSDRNINYAWKEELLAILRLYEQATPGSTIEEKDSSIVWHYRKADDRSCHSMLPLDRCRYLRHQPSRASEARFAA